jgi:nucleoside-diphosphate-sugar epimerase
MIRRLEIRRVVWGSSISVFGYRPTSDVKTESSPLSPDGFYGGYKAANETQARLYESVFGIPSTAIRIAFSYGYGRTRGTGSWVQEMMSRPAVGDDAVCSGGDVLVPWQHVEDTASILVAALRAEPDGFRVFNTRGEPRWKHDAAAFIEATVPGVSVSIVGDESGYATGIDDTPLRTALNWAPRHSMEDGILRTLNAYRAAAGLAPYEMPSDWAPTSRA